MIEQLTRVGRRSFEYTSAAPLTVAEHAELAREIHRMICSHPDDCRTLHHWTATGQRESAGARILRSAWRSVPPDRAGHARRSLT